MELKTDEIQNCIDGANGRCQYYQGTTAQHQLQALTDKIAELEKQVKILEDEREYYKALGNEKDAYERGRNSMLQEIRLKKKEVCDECHKPIKGKREMIGNEIWCEKCINEHFVAAQKDGKEN